MLEKRTCKVYIWFQQAEDTILVSKEINKFEQTFYSFPFPFNHIGW